MRIGICGGTGLIGKALVEELIQRGDEVTIFTRKKDILKEFSYFIPPISKLTKQSQDSNLDSLKQIGTIEIISNSPPSAEDLSQLDVVINLVGESILGARWSEKHKSRLRNSRVDYTKTLVENIENANPKPQVFFSASAIGYYGMWAESSPEFSEDSQAGKDFLAELCVDWEKEALKAAEFCRVIIGRIGIVLTTKGGALAQMLPAFQAFVGGQVATGKQYMSWIHIQDIVRAILFLTNHSSYSGVFNLTAPNPVTNKEFSKTLADSLNRPCFFQVPAFALEILYGAGAEVVVKGQKVIPKRLLELGFEFQFPNLKEALSNLLNSKI